MNKDQIISDLRNALRSMCEYASHLGEEMAKLGNASYRGDFIAQYKDLLKDPDAKPLKVKETFDIKGRGRLYLVISSEENGFIDISDRVSIDGRVGVVTSLDKILNNFGVCDHAGVMVRFDENGKRT